MTIWGPDDVGCHADGSFGHEHARRRIANRLDIVLMNGDMISEDRDKEIRELISSLKGEMPDDAWDEDAALEILNEYTEPGQTWQFLDGDFGLYQDEGD